MAVRVQNAHGNNGNGLATGAREGTAEPQNRRVLTFDGERQFLEHPVSNPTCQRVILPLALARNRRPLLLTDYFHRLENDILVVINWQNVTPVSSFSSLIRAW
jgi:hypothetical protein